MTSFLSSLNLDNKGSEVCKLRAENQVLNEELTQCQADKEFVWSLWKRLQVANPDITQAVAMVVQREKEKNEMKDRKVLDILSSKDRKIDELQALISDQGEEISQLITKKLEFEDRASKLERDRSELEQRVSEIDPERREQASREAVRDLDKQNLDLKQELSKKSAELERLKFEREDLCVSRETGRDRIKHLEEELQNNEETYNRNTQEFDDMKKLLKKYETQLTSQQRDLQAKNKELEKVRKELSSLWHTHQQTGDHATQQADLIRQLQFLQKDTQKMLKNTETAYSMEATSLHTENKSLKFTYQDLTRQISSQAKTIAELQGMIESLQRQLEDRGDKASTDYSDQDDLQYKLDTLQQDVNNLKGRSRSLNTRRERSISPGMEDSRRSRSKVKQRSRSLSPHKKSDLEVVHRRLQHTEKKLSDAQLLLHLKTRELEELRSTHGRRLERLKSLQSNHKLLKKQLTLMEEEVNGPRKKKKRVCRSDPKSLQNEDSDTVWNELNYFRKHANKLNVENMNLSEECDAVKVKLSQLEATNHELRTCLEQEREELQFLIAQQKEQDRSSTPVLDQQEEISKQRQMLGRYRKQIDRLKQQLDQVHDHQRHLEETSNKVMEEKRALKSEVNMLRQQDSTYRINTADYKQEIARLQREMKRLRKKKVKSPVSATKQYQQSLNRSIHEMSHVFDNFNKDGWEDLSESDHVTPDVMETTGTTETGHSLGEAIVEHAQNSGIHDRSFDEPRTVNRERETEAEEGHYRRLSRKEQPVSYRSVALSPVRFDHRTRSVGVSPIHSSPPSAHQRPHVVSKRTNHTLGGNTRLVATLRQRVSTLQTQVITLKQTKEMALRNNAELKNMVDQLTADLQGVNSKLQTQRLNVQRVTSDLDLLRADKETLEHRIQDYSAEESANQHSEQEWGSLTARLKNASNEVSKQLTQIKELKSEITSQQERLAQLQDKNKSLERDNSQKRILVEDMKSKVKVVNDNTQSDAKILEEVEQKLRVAMETSQRYKTQIDSLKQRLSVATREKYDNEDKVIKLSEEIDKKSRQISEQQSKVRSLQSTVAIVEKTAKQQLTSLANQSEAAIDMAQDKLMLAGGKLQEYSKFVKILAHSLVNSLQQSRHFLTHQKLKREQPDKGGDHNSSQQKYRSVACDLLNLSQSDLDDILSAPELQNEKLLEGRKMDDIKNDKKWTKRWEKIIQSKDEFSVPLVEVFMEKVEERCQVASELAIT